MVEEDLGKKESHYKPGIRTQGISLVLGAFFKFMV
jgi:hypothetical protein